MKCPACHAMLTRIEHEKRPVYQCPDCSGYLVAETQLSAAEFSQEAEELSEEISSGGEGSGQTRPVCPKCLAEKMTKQLVRASQRLGDSLPFDICARCGAAWLDAGELERLELDVVGGIKAVEHFAAKRRAERLSREEEERIRRQIAALPPPKEFLGGLLGDFLGDPRILTGLLAAAVITGLLIYLYLYLTGP